MDEQINLENEQEDFEFNGYKKQQAADDTYFDLVVENLQEIVISPEFEKVQRAFVEKHCPIFQDTEATKAEHTEIFKEYQNQIEKHLEKLLAHRIANFNMNKFMTLLNTRTDQIDEQLLDMLLSFTEFEQFKKLMVDYRNYYEQQQRIKLLTIKTVKNSQTKKVKGANTIFSNNQCFQFQKSPEAMLEQLKKPVNKKKKTSNLNIKQDQEGNFHPDLLLSVKPLRKN